MPLRTVVTAFKFNVDMAKLKAIDARLNSIIKRSNVAGEGFRQMGAKMSAAGRNLTTKVTAPILAMGAGVLAASGKFEASMNRVQALTGATGKELVKMSDLAKQLGIKTQFSASQAADAMANLGLAGFNTAEILRATPGILDLASASQLDMASAADISAKVIRGFGLEAGEANRVADILTKTFTTANTDLSELGNAFKFAGPVAAGFGRTIEETASALALMADAGFTGSMGGTALRGSLAKLANPTGEAEKVLKRLGLTAQDVNPQLNSISDIVRKFGEAGASTSDLITILGQRAGPGFQALVARGADELDRFTATLQNAGGTAKRIGDVQMKGVNGALKELKSAAEGLAIAIGESGVLGAATKFFKSLASGIRRLAKTNKTILITVAGFAGLLAVLGPLLILVGSMVGSVGAMIATWNLLVPVFASISAAATAANTSVLGLIATTLAVPLAIAALGAAIALIIDDIVASLKGRKSFFGEIFDIETAIEFWKKQLTDFGKWISDQVLSWFDIGTALDFWKKKLDDLKSLIPDFLLPGGGGVAAVTQAAVTPATAPAIQQGGTTVSSTNSVNVTVNAQTGASPEDISAAVAEQVRSELQSRDRKILATLGAR